MDLILNKLLENQTYSIV